MRLQGIIDYEDIEQTLQGITHGKANSNSVWTAWGTVGVWYDIKGMDTGAGGSEDREK